MEKLEEGEDTTGTMNVKKPGDERPGDRSFNSEINVLHGMKDVSVRVDLGSSPSCLPFF